MDWDEYRERVKEALDTFVFDDTIVQALQEARHHGRQIFVGGNGGSAALTVHYSCDLSKGAVPNWERNHHRPAVINLTGNIGYFTAIANDRGYEEVFRQQLVNHARELDVLVMISSSGNSPNVVKAAEYAKQIGMVTIGVTGFDGGSLKELCDHSAHLPDEGYEVTEDIHHIFGHFLTVALREGPQ